VLGTDDVMEILEYLVGRNPALLRSRDRDSLLPLHVACRRGPSFVIVQFLVNLHKVSVKSFTPEGDPPAAISGMLCARAVSRHYLFLDENIPRFGLPI
jgi:hypothetical protein